MHTLVCIHPGHPHSPGTCKPRDCHGTPRVQQPAIGSLDFGGLHMPTRSGLHAHQGVHTAMAHLTWGLQMPTRSGLHAHQRVHTAMAHPEWPWAPPRVHTARVTPCSQPLSPLAPHPFAPSTPGGSGGPGDGSGRPCLPSAEFRCPPQTSQGTGKWRNESSVFTGNTQAGL